MLTKRFVLFLYLFIPFIASAQGNALTGIVKDNSGLPVQGAIITIPDLKAGAVTDSNGRYSMANLQRGTYLVQVRMLGYSTLTLPVVINGAIQKDFQISESILERSEVVVTGTSLTTERRKSTIPITSISIKELQEYASANIIDAIARLPGVSQVTTGPAISKPIIRGLGANRILVISDNVRQEGQQWGDEHGIEIDDYNVSKVEVLKGPASLAYGSDALAGVINIITDEPLHETQTTGGISLNYQTNNGLAAVNANMSGRKKDFSWKIYGTIKAAHDYRNQYDGYVFNSRFDNINYGASAGINKRWGYSRISFSSFNQNVGIAEGDRDSLTGNFLKLVNKEGAEEEMIVSEDDGKSYSRQLPYQKIIHQKIAISNGLYMNDGARLALTLGYQQNNRKEFENVLTPNEAGLNFLLKTLSYDVKCFFKDFDNWKITAGVNGMYQRNINAGLEFLIPDYHLFDIGAYAIAKKDIGKFSVSGGLRYDHRHIEAEALYIDSLGRSVFSPNAGSETKFTGFSRAFSNITGSIGLSYSYNTRTTLKINVAKGYRAPNIAELSANGVHEGTIRYEYGNNNLQAEGSIQGDAGIEYSAEHIYVTATVFANYIQNFIYTRKLLSANGNDSIPATGNEEAYSAFLYDQDHALLYGGELYFDLHPHPLDWLHFDNTVSYVRGKRIAATADSIKNLPFIPPLRWVSEIRVQKKSLNKRLKEGFVKIGVDINFDQPKIFNAYTTETFSPGYVLLNAGVGFNIVGKKQNTICSFILSGQNLLDAPYQNHLSRLRYAPLNNTTGRRGIWNMGRNISVMVNVPLMF